MSLSDHPSPQTKPLGFCPRPQLAAQLPTLQVPVLAAAVLLQMLPSKHEEGSASHWSKGLECHVHGERLPWSRALTPITPALGTAAPSSLLALE